MSVPEFAAATNTLYDAGRRTREALLTAGPALQRYGRHADDPRSADGP